MLGNFSYGNAIKLYFGDDSLKFLNEELPKYEKNVVEDAEVLHPQSEVYTVP